MDKILDYIAKNRERVVGELLELISIPSISSDPAFSDAVFLAAEMVRERLGSAGLDSAVLIKTTGHPLVYAEKMVDSSRPTVLIYGHYDVQPPDPLELWETPPFEPIIREGMIYGRGASDDKGQMYAHIKAAEYLLASGELHCNLKFLIEGEEESGSVSLPDFIETHREMLFADLALISDTAMLPDNIPAITVGLRGLAAFEVTVRGPNRDLHSGIFGGAVSNPAVVLCQMIAALHDKDHLITVPGLYDSVVELSVDERAELGKVAMTADWYLKEVGVSDVVCETGYTPFECTTIRPSLDVNGINSGYCGEGLKTVLPAVASAKLSIRLVPNQKSELVSDQLAVWLKQLAPAGVEVTVSKLYGGEPVHVPVDLPAYQAASQAMSEVFGREPQPIRGGASIPVVALLERQLGLKTILLGFGQDSDAIHSPNEHFGVENFLKGIMTSIRFLQKIMAS
ncbi:MAG: peptidase dimerization domain protein [Deltaproteobacteria bacterium RIFOXYD12_FULL_55_16]|nr:MAG: peptidase dimerization domain protein [Deltaproteobacteria bacterium RIFOXYD12_FULL_55_16]